MRVVLCPVPEHPDAVGTVDREILTYAGRDAYAGGRPIAQEEIGEALAQAVEQAATALWGSDYLGSLSRVSGLNRRSVVGDRITRNGVPDWLLRILAYAAGHPSPRALGYLMLAAAEVLDADAEQARAELGALARQGLEDALALVARARDMKRLPAGTR
ncbi:hypothetical protein ASG51_21215 [Methylobacterium sp. Leaf465]|uniref:hypothetical protein n=1 Tax=Methylobacterium sp. Leaf465 TaxID=1736385 RepID=UPI0006F66A77|nr:hypothetical protein [Methylobacterium sp. Leaf465]KQT80919.1 hypothetical protein ASG51_21215 [Methylobacterium sp. Leaf465]